MTYKDLLTLTSAARLLGVSRVTIWRYVQAGRLTLVEIDGRPFVRRKDVLKITPKRGRPKK